MSLRRAGLVVVLVCGSALAAFQRPEAVGGCCGGFDRVPHVADR